MSENKEVEGGGGGGGTVTSIKTLCFINVSYHLY